jgi:CheY-like chemotaxis protein
MKVLIVEDDQNKLRQLVNFIKEKYPNTELSEKRSYQSGLREISNVTYNLLILDMSMPTFEITPKESGGRPRAFAGKEVLSQMTRRHINVPVIIVTQFETFGDGENKKSLEELRNELEELRDPKYKGTIYYSAGQDSWKTELSSYIGKLMEGERND